MESSSVSRPALSWRKKTCFALLATILGLSLIEGLLTVSGITPLSHSDDPFVGFDHQPLFRTDPKSEPATFRTRPQKLPWFNDQTFPVVKPAGTLRIFCLGGSTTYGRPYRDSTSFCGQLRQLLKLAMPDRNVEVINAGGVSYASYRIERLCQETLRYDPDALIIYTGHNEFLEQRTYAPLKKMSRWRRNATSWLAHTRTYSAMHQLSGPLVDEFRLETEVKTMLDGVVGLEAYERDDQLHQQVLTHFQWNLTRIAQRTSQANIPLMLVAPASNLADISPFKSQWQSEETRRQAEPRLGQAREMIQTGNDRGAISELEAAAQHEDRYADLHFELGGCWLRLAQPKKAEAAFQRALEEDVCPVRAHHEFVESIRETAGQWPHISLVDFEAMLREDCLQRFGHRCPGDQYFLDHVHPTVHWHGQLAVAIAKALSSHMPVSLKSQQLDELAPQMQSWAAGQLTPALKNEGLRNLAKVYNWAGKHEKAGEFAVRAAEAMPEDGESHLLAAPYRFEQGDLQSALYHARLAVRFRPDLADTHRLLGQLLAETASWDEAAASFLHWTRLEPNDPEAWAMLGGVEFQRQRWAEAVRHLTRAEELGRATRDLRFQLAAALHQSGATGRAETRYQALLQEYPVDVDAMFNLALLLMETRREREAADWLRKLLALEKDEEAQRLLQTIEGP